MPVYRFYELRVSSPRPLWNVVPTAVDDDSEADIRIAFVQADEPLPAWTDASWTVVRDLHGSDWSMTLSTAPDRELAVFRLHSCIRADETIIFYGHDAARIVVAWHSAERTFDAAWPALSSWVLGSVLGFAMCLRGLPTLHGSVVAVDGRAVGLLGVSGAGKSTLAAAFVTAGHVLMADDHLVVVPGASGYCAAPGPPRRRLWPNSLDVLGARGPESTLATDGDGKYLFEPPRPVISAQPLPLAAIYILAPRDPGRVAIAIKPLSPAGALNALANQRFCMTPLTSTHAADSLTALSALVPHVPVRMLYRPNGLETLPGIVDAICQDAADHVC